jgi:hypothetical protein
MYLNPTRPFAYKLTTDAVSDTKFLLPPGATLPAGMKLVAGRRGVSTDVTTGTVKQASFERSSRPPHLPRSLFGHGRRFRALSVSYSTPCTDGDAVAVWGRVAGVPQSVEARRPTFERPRGPCGSSTKTSDTDAGIRHRHGRRTDDCHSWSSMRPGHTSLQPEQ